MSPSDLHWFEPRREVLSVLSPARITGVQIQLVAICSLAEKKEIGQRETGKLKEEDPQVTMAQKWVLRGTFSIFSGLKAA